jgi:hypothetical protein
LQPHSLESAMSERDEMRRLIDVIEKGAATASVEQNAEDLKLFVNTASFIANKLDAKLRASNQPSKLNTGLTPLPLPKQRKPPAKPIAQKPVQQTAKPGAISKATSSADFERLRSIKPTAPKAPLSPIR